MAPPPPSTVLDDAPTAPAPAGRPQRRRRSWVQRTVLGVGVLAVFAVLAAIAGVGYGIFRFNQINKEKLSLSKVGASQPQNFLVVGSDTRDVIDKSDPNYNAFNGRNEAPGGQRSDTIIVMRVDPKQHTVDMLSLPRDLWVPIAGTGESQRINTAYSLSDGRQRLIDTIQDDFGIPINHYIEVNFKGFQSVVSAIGGVPMYFDKPMRDGNSGLNVAAGCLTLDGEQALAFARARHLEYRDPTSGRWRTDPTGDLGRITRQQVFIRKVIDQSASQATSLDLAGTNKLLGAAVDNLTVDSGFGIDTMLALAREFKAFSGQQLQSHTLPTTPFTTDGGADVLRLDQSAAQPIFDLFRGNGPTTSIQPSDVTLSVRNSGGVNGAAAKAQGQLQALGFTVSGVDTGATTTSTTRVLYGSGAADQAKLLASHVKGNPDATEDSSLAQGEVRLVIGTDFGGIVDATGKAVSATGSTASGRSSSTTAPPAITDQVGEAPPGMAPEGVSCG